MTVSASRREILLCRTRGKGSAVSSGMVSLAVVRPLSRRSLRGMDRMGSTLSSMVAGITSSAGRRRGRTVRAGLSRLIRRSRLVRTSDVICSRRGRVFSFGCRDNTVKYVVVGSVFNKGATKTSNTSGATNNTTTLVSNRTATIVNGITPINSTIVVCD